MKENREKINPILLCVSVPSVTHGSEMMAPGVYIDLTHRLNAELLPQPFYCPAWKNDQPHKIVSQATKGKQTH